MGIIYAVKHFLTVFTFLDSRSTGNIGQCTMMLFLPSKSPSHHKPGDYRPKKTSESDLSKVSQTILVSKIYILLSSQWTSNLATKVKTSAPLTSSQETVVCSSLLLLQQILTCLSTFYLSPYRGGSILTLGVANIFQNTEAWSPLYFLSACVQINIIFPPSRIT